MLFNSYIFIFVFLPVVLLGYHFLGRYKSQFLSFGWLAATSLVFYGYWNPIYLLLILFSIGVNYWIGCKLCTHKNSALLTFGVVINVSLLAYFKYFNFFIDSSNYLLGTDWNFEQILLPLAISFFTFQQIAYLVDAYRGLCKEYRFIHYCLFVTFFPQLIAGPIVHHSEMLPQFAKKSALSLRKKNFVIGVTIFVVGLFKKVVIADTFALYATPIFFAADSGQNLTFFEAWQGALAYTFQLYFDFSGYSDMAIGLARMFGIRLPLNFNSPYKATNIIDFWRCWHMTLSRFLRDYIYIPLGGSRHGGVRRYTNLFLTMLIGGFWHGAGINFIFWGMLHGLYLMINHAWRNVFFWKHVRNNVVYRFSCLCITLLAVTVSWVFFRAETFHGTTLMLSSMVNLPNSIESLIGGYAQTLLSVGVKFEGGNLGFEHLIGGAAFLAAYAFVLMMPNTNQFMLRYYPVCDCEPLTPGHRLLQWKPRLCWAAVIGIMAMISLLSMTKVSEFLYFQF